MEILEIISILGIIGTVVAPILAILFKRFFIEKDYNKIDKSRKRAIAGKWKGEFSQNNLVENEKVHGTIIMNLITKGKIIRGVKRLENKVHMTNPSFTIKGGFKHNRFLVLDYKNEKNEIIQFGTAILELSAKADKLIGMFVSYGAESQSIIKEEIVLVKE